MLPGDIPFAAFSQSRTNSRNAPTKLMRIGGTPSLGGNTGHLEPDQVVGDQKSHISCATRSGSCLRMVSSRSSMWSDLAEAELDSQRS